jgi:hypothetical protein
MGMRGASSLRVEPAGEGARSGAPEEEKIK